MAAETKYGFTIDGVVYAIPESMKVDEYRIIFKYSGLTGKELSAGDDTVLLSNPDCMAALMHIAYRREHLAEPYDDIAEVVGRQDVEAALENLFDPAEGDGLPPASTTEREPSLLRSSVEKSKDSGSDSRESSDLQDVQQTATGTSESDTRSTSDLTSSVA